MTESTLSSRRAYQGRLLTVDVLEVAMEGGGRGIREVVRHPGAVAVLGRRPDGKYVFVRQYRTAVDETLVEVVAGCLHPGEDPADCAAREMREETGYSPRTLARLGTVYPSPGYTTEQLHLFCADLPLSPGRAAPEEDERIEVLALAAEQVDAMIRAGEIRDAKTLALWLWSRESGFVPPRGI
jgi:ADP-ribose pyrophosphatase